jgi:hypothetical protein
MCRNMLAVHGTITATAGEDNLDVNFRSLFETSSPRRHNPSIFLVWSSKNRLVRSCLCSASSLATRLVRLSCA